MTAAPTTGLKLNLTLQIRGGLKVAVPPTLSAITTYVLLEQEGWFEKEGDLLPHFLKPGMIAIDIGANFGLYSLPMAQLVAPGGRVFAYEPGREARALLDSSRKLNGLANLDVIDLALSDNAKEGHLGFANSTELRALNASGGGEPVGITSLDLENAARGWRSVDFIKIDAEGEEERIIAGGRMVFATHSPLVMFEIKAGNTTNERLRSIFPTIGYRVFRKLSGAPILVPDDASQPLDQYELNLFAAKPDRADELARQGLLVTALSDWAPDDRARKFARSLWERQAFAEFLKRCGCSSSPADPQYQDALVAYAAWRSPDRPAAMRCGALFHALESIRAVCKRGLTAERASTWARIASEWGARVESVAALRQLLHILDNARVQLKEPFWPAASRFDNIDPDDQPAEWIAAAAAEQHERTAGFSSFFTGPSPLLSRLCSQKFAGAEMERRRILTAAKSGQRPRVPERLRTPAPDHLNADLWRSGAVPGTQLTAHISLSPADLLQEALALHRSGAVAEAAARYAEVLRADPANADAHYYLGMMSCQDGRFAEGAQFGRKSLASNPRHAGAHVLLGRALNALGQREEALASFDDAIALAPDLAQAHACRADALSDLGRNAEAIDSYDRALALAPDAVEDWFNRGLALHAVGRHEEALASFDRAIVGRANFAEAYLRRANVQQDLRHHADALADVDKALAIKPRLTEAWLCRGKILRELKRYDEAFAAHDKALALNPDLAGAWLGRGNVAFERKAYDDALTAFDKAVALMPELTEAWLGRGNVFFVRARYNDALAAYDKALTLSSCSRRSVGWLEQCVQRPRPPSRCPGRQRTGRNLRAESGRSLVSARQRFSEEQAARRGARGL